MKDIRAALRTFLLADVDISALVGGTRVYPIQLPQGGTEGIVQNLISEQTDYHMQGPSGLVQARIQVDCWDATADDAVTLANMVKDRLSGHKGVIAYGSDSPQDEITVHGIFAEQGQDAYDDVAKLHTRRRDYLIWYWEN